MFFANQLLLNYYYFYNCYNIDLITIHYNKKKYMFQVHDLFGVPLKYLMYCCNCGTVKKKCMCYSVSINITKKQQFIGF